MVSVFQSYYESPIGLVEIKSTEDILLSVKMDPEIIQESHSISDIIMECKQQLQSYFSGESTSFNLPLFQKGTPLQMQTWKMLETVPYGQTISYKQLAVLCNTPYAYRAVGTANSKNQHWIIVPCHRVIASDGSIGGYSGEIWRKKWLLTHETEILKRNQ